MHFTVYVGFVSCVCTSDTKDVVTLQHVTRDNVTRAGMQSSSLLIHGDCPATEGGDLATPGRGGPAELDLYGYGCHVQQYPFTISRNRSLVNKHYANFFRIWFDLGGIKCKWIFQQFTMMDSCYSLLDPCL